MSLLPLLATTLLSGVGPVQNVPKLWLAPDGQAYVNGEPTKPQVTKGARLFRSPNGAVYDFDGTSGGVLFPDLSAFKFTRSFTISTWVNLRAYWNAGPGAQILFRGDNQLGHDPYFLKVHGDGKVSFGVYDAKNEGIYALAEIPLRKWTHLVASFDDKSGTLKIWRDGETVGMAQTSHRPYRDLKADLHPGLGVGNVQSPTMDNEPLNGQIFDLRLYEGVLTPDDVDYRPEIWGQLVAFLRSGKRGE